MADRIFKYELQVEQRQVLQLPAQAEPLSVEVLFEQPVLFALHRDADEDHQILPRIIRIARTGERFNAAGCTFIGTLAFDIGHTFHVFEQKSGHGGDPLEPRFKGDYAEVRDAVRE